MRLLSCEGSLLLLFILMKVIFLCIYTFSLVTNKGKWKTSGGSPRWRSKVGSLSFLYNLKVVVKMKIRAAREGKQRIVEKNHVSR